MMQAIVLDSKNQKNQLSYYTTLCLVTHMCGMGQAMRCSFEF